MTQIVRRAGAVLCAVTMLGACGASRAGTGGGVDRNMITLEEIVRTHHATADALVRALRPHWLEVRGGGSFGARVGRRVYLDDLQVGGLDQLRGIPVSNIESLQYFDGPAATQRWGSDHSAGVILVRSRAG